MLKKLFCKHIYRTIPSDYMKLGWAKCERCGKEKFTGEGIELTHFKFPEISQGKPPKKPA